MSEVFKKFEEEEIPEVPIASRPESTVHTETHETGFISEPAEKKIEKTRGIILEKFGIAPENVFLEPVGEGEVRKIRAFIILRNMASAEGWYAEGHHNHVVLLGQIIERFGDGHGLQNIGDLHDENFQTQHPWETFKGFIDPYQDGFRAFPKSREALIGELEEHQDLNDLEGETLHEIENGEKPIPNWFLSGHEAS